MKVAVIDISSSSVSFIVAATKGTDAEILFKERTGLSLRQYMDGKSLSQRGSEKLIAAIGSAMAKCRALEVERAYLIGTAALRRIDNFDEVHSAVYSSLGMTINLIDGKQEGYLDLIANECYSVYDRAVMVDIGGASMEICGFGNTLAEQTTFLPFGVLDLNRKFVGGIQPVEEEAKKIAKYVRKKFDDVELAKKGEYSAVVLVGATNLALYDVYSDFVKQEGEERRIDVKRFKKLVKHLVEDAGRSALVLKSAPEKVYMIATAAVVLKALFKRLKPDNVVVSDRGVKEGYLRHILEQGGEGAAYTFEYAAAEPVKVTEPVKATAEEHAEVAGTAQTAKRRGRPRKVQAQQPAEKTAKRKYTRRKSAAAENAPAEEKAEKTATRTTKKTARTGTKRTARASATPKDIPSDGAQDGGNVNNTYNQGEDKSE